MTRLSTAIRKKLIQELETLPFYYNYDTFQEQNKAILEHFKHFKFINDFYKRNFALEREYFRFLILKNSQLVISLHYYFDKSTKAEKDFSKNSFSYNSINDYWKIFTIITNNYIVLNDLLSNGKDYQAKVIFRNTIELTELCICILGNEEFYNFFKKENAVEYPKDIFQTLKFNTIKKWTQKIIVEVKEMPNNNMPKVVWDEYLQIRQEFYEDSSRYIHSNFLNLMLGSHVQMIETDVVDVKEMVVHNLGGIVNTETKQNFKNVIIYDSISYTLILILLIEKHKLFFAKIDKDANHLTVLSKFNWDLLGQILR